MKSLLFFFLLFSTLLFTSCNDSEVESEKHSITDNPWMMNPDEYVKTKNPNCQNLNAPINTEPTLPFACCDDIENIETILAGDLNYDGEINNCDLQVAVDLLRDFDLDGDGALTQDDFNMRCRFCQGENLVCTVQENNCDQSNCWTHCEDVLWLQIFPLTALDPAPITTSNGTYNFALTIDDLCVWLTECRGITHNVNGNNPECTSFKPRGQFGQLSSPLVSSPLVSSPLVSSPLEPCWF